MSASRWVHIDFEEIVRETDKALLVRLDDVGEVWIPLSQICDPEDYQEGDRDGSMSISEWIAEQKGIA